MKIYETKAEADLHPEDGKILYVVTFNGTERFAYSSGTSSYSVLASVAKMHGMKVCQVVRLPVGSRLMRIKSLPKAEALELLEKLRLEISAKPDAAAVATPVVPAIATVERVEI